jgi:phage/plasmid primase-like uncharacterized protein
MSEAEIQAGFAAELERIGLRLDGPPIMDGAVHRARLEGARGKRTSGWYRGCADGSRRSVGGNMKTGEIVRWPPQQIQQRSLSPEEIAQRRAAAVADQAAREAAQREKEERAAAEATRIWQAAKPARSDHPYLISKGIRPGILRQAPAGETAQMTDKRIAIGGRLIVPMRDEDGKVWNVQMISKTGSKVFLPGRKKGLFTVLGKEVDPKTPLLFAEGYATGATLHNTTALRTVIAFDSGNLLPVAQAIHAKHPGRPKIFAADNDHHLPGVETNLQASGDGSLAVNWQAGATGKAEGGNTVEYRMAGSPDWLRAAAGAQDTTLTVKGLMPNARYDVRVFSTEAKMPLPNVGVVKAGEAARAVGGAVVIPSFESGDPGTDWNDYERKHGSARLALALAAQGVPINTQPARTVQVAPAQDQTAALSPQKRTP